MIRGRAVALPLKSRSCSSVLMVTVICYLDDISAAFREIHRVLLASGISVIAFLERDGPVARKYRDGEGEHRFLSEAWFSMSEEIIAHRVASGLRVTSIDSRDGFSVIADMKA